MNEDAIKKEKVVSFMEIQQIPNGHGFSPDGGEFESKDGTLYWKDGTITILKPGEMVRYMMNNWTVKP